MRKDPPPRCNPPPRPSNPGSRVTAVMEKVRRKFMEGGQQGEQRDAVLSPRDPDGYPVTRLYHAVAVYCRLQPGQQRFPHPLSLPRPMSRRATDPTFFIIAECTLHGNGGPPNPGKGLTGYLFALYWKEREIQGNIPNLDKEGPLCRRTPTPRNRECLEAAAAGSVH